MIMEDHVYIFDTTLRDGEQAPGCTMTFEEKMDVARQLARLNVDIIEAGFPAASPGDWAAVHKIASEIGTANGPTIAALARAVKGDIDRAWSAIQPAVKKRIHTFISTSDIHIEHQLRSTRADVLRRVREMVRHARSLCEDVEFSPMDASRSEPAYMYEVLAVAIEEGASTINIPDTVGYATPEEFGALIAGVRTHVPGADRVTLSVHCHDDLGLAVANSLAGVRAGARQIECTINGIGERAGNASLEEVVMTLHTRRDAYGVTTGIRTRELARSSRLVSSFIGIPVPPNKAIVGANAFAHESGIHQDGVLKNPLTFEIMSAEMVGLESNELVLGKHSGRHAFRTHLETLGYQLSDNDLEQVFERFKRLCDKKKRVDDRDIEVLIAGETQPTPEMYKLLHMQVSAGSGLIPVATVQVECPDGETRIESSHGTGPVDAIYKAIDRVIQRPSQLLEFSINAVTEGIDAVAAVTVRIRELGAETESCNGDTTTMPRRQRIYSGYGVNTDITLAAAESYMGALNKLLTEGQRRQRAEEAAYAAGYDKSDPTYAVDMFARTQGTE